MAANVIHYFGDQTIDNSEMVTQKITQVIGPVATNLAAEVTRATGREGELNTSIENLRNSLENQISNLEHDEQELTGKLGDLSKLKTASKTEMVAAVNELCDKLATYLQNQSKIITAIDGLATRKELRDEQEARMLADRGLQENITSEHIGCHDVLDMHEKQIEENWKADQVTHQKNMERIEAVGKYAAQLNKQGLTVRDNLPMLTPAADGTVIADKQIIIYIDTGDHNKIRFYQATVRGGAVSWTEVYQQQ